ncbi:MAG: DUF2785 domain-containing protein [Nocardioides sp.]
MVSRVGAGVQELDPHRPLGEVTADLTRMLGDTDPEVRLSTGLATLQHWLRQGVYDDLLGGLGDGMASGLRHGLGEAGTATVLRRAASALVLADAIDRDNAKPLIGGPKALDWGDRLATWLLRERDLRAEVPGAGRADAIACGARALASLANSPHLQRNELAVVLDVLADRALAEVDLLLSTVAIDELASACLAVLGRGQTDAEALHAWLARVTGVASNATGPTSVNAEAFVRALFVRASVGKRAGEHRADMLLTLVDSIRSTARDHG